MGNPNDPKTSGSPTETTTDTTKKGTKSGDLTTMEDAGVDDNTDPTTGGPGSAPPGG